MSRTSRRLSIAVIGSGAAGITAAHLLQRTHEVTLFEKAAELGGHAHSHTIDNGLEPPFDVDTAFVIFNSRSYPLFHGLLGELGLTDRVRPAEMSFSYSNEARGFRYALNRGLGGLFADRRNLLAPGLYRLFPELLRFRLRSARDLRRRDDLGKVSLAAYLAQCGYSRAFVEDFLYPTAMAVWSVPLGRILEFPASSFLRFLDNHRYLGGRRGRWRTLAGGCRQYVRAFEAVFTGRIVKGRGVLALRRHEGGVVLRLEGGEVASFDKVIVATHADQALRLLEDPSEPERRCLGAWKYQRTPAFLHEDAGVMPGDRRLWASWNVRYHSNADAITYYLNRVQGLGSRRDYFVTLGESQPGRMLARYDYDHPVYDFAAVATQPELPRLNGQRHTFYCGSYFGFGFHEDAIRSAAEAAAWLGAGISTGDAPSRLSQRAWEATAPASVE